MVNQLNPPIDTIINDSDQIAIAIIVTIVID